VAGSFPFLGISGWTGGWDLTEVGAGVVSAMNNCGSARVQAVVTNLFSGDHIVQLTSKRKS